MPAEPTRLPMAMPGVPELFAVKLSELIAWGEGREGVVAEYGKAHSVTACGHFNLADGVYEIFMPMAAASGAG